MISQGWDATAILHRREVECAELGVALKITNSRSIAGRLFNLLPIIRRGFYHPDLHGSFQSRACYRFWSLNSPITIWQSATAMRQLPVLRD